MRLILASDYIDSFKDKNGNVPVLLNCGIRSKNKIILLRISAELAKYLYKNMMGVYYTNTLRYQYMGETISRDYYDRLIRPDMYEKPNLPNKVFGVIEIFVDDFPNLRLN